MATLYKHGGIASVRRNPRTGYLVALCNDGMQLVRLNNKWKSSYQWDSVLDWPIWHGSLKTPSQASALEGEVVLIWGGNTTPIEQAPVRLGGSPECCQSRDRCNTCPLPVNGPFWNGSWYLAPDHNHKVIN